MINFDFSKRKLLFAIISLAVIVAGVVVFLIFGFASDRYTDGYTTYTAKISYDADFSAVDEYALYDDVKAIVGKNADVKLTMDSLTYQSILKITVANGAQIDEQGVVTMLNDKYPDFAIDKLDNVSFGGSMDGAYAITIIAIIVVLIIIGFIISLFMLSTANSLIAVLCTVNDVLFVAAIYTLSRISSIMSLVAAILVTIVASFTLCIVRLRSIEKVNESKKKIKVSDVVNTALNGDLSGIISLLVISALFVAAFVIVGVVFEYVGVIYIGAMFFTALFAALYSSTLIAPNMWELKK